MVVMNMFVTASSTVLFILASIIWLILLICQQRRHYCSNRQIKSWYSIFLKLGGTYFNHLSSYKSKNNDCTLLVKLSTSEICYMFFHLKGLSIFKQLFCYNQHKCLSVQIPASTLEICQPSIQLADLAIESISLIRCLVFFK